MTTRNELYHNSGATLYQDARANLVVYKLDRAGALDVTNPVTFFKELLLQSSQESDSEKTQVALGSDAPKLYAFGRQHRFFVYQATLIDTQLDRDITVDTATGPSVWTGAAYSQLQDFFNEHASLYACAANRTLVQLTYNSRRLYGAMNQLTVSTDAMQPFKYDVQFSFYATAIEDINV